MEFHSGITGFMALYIVMISAFSGWVVIGRAPAILQPPLMSGAVLVHGIIVMGALFVLLNAVTVLDQTLGFIAVALGAANAAGGYVVGTRMFAKFRVGAGAGTSAERGTAIPVAVRKRASKQAGTKRDRRSTRSKKA
jgi:NAD(P) transhydrogenase subunit alpha